MQIIVIGLGSMGKRRIRLLQFMQPKIQIMGVDRREDRRLEAETLFSVQCTSEIPKFTNYEGEISAFVCTEPLSHFTIIKECLMLCYNVFTEINLVLQGHGELLHLATEKNRILFVSSTPLYRMEMKKIIEILKDVSIPVQYIYHVGQYLPDWHPWENIDKFFVSNKKTNGCREILGIELPWMTHAFGKIIKVECTKNTLTSLKIPCADNYVIQLFHESGTSGIFIADIVCRHPVRHLEIYNENLYLVWDGRPNTLERKNLQTGEIENIGDLIYLHQNGYGEFINEHAYMNEIEEFFQVLAGSKPIYTMEQEEEIIEVIDKIEEV